MIPGTICNLWKVFPVNFSEFELLEKRSKSSNPIPKMNLVQLQVGTENHANSSNVGITNLDLNLVTVTYQQCDLGLVT